jgi:hypothetical protein
VTLLTIANAVFDEVQIPRLSQIAGSTNAGARRLLHYANSHGDALARLLNWQVLRREHAFTGVAGEDQTAAAIPSDLGRFVPGTFYNRTGNQYISGPIPAGQWQALKAQGGASYYRRFIYRNGSLSVFPAFTGGEECAYEYISANWCEDSGGTGKTAMSADTDVARIDETLLALRIASYWLQAEGMQAAHVERMYRERLGQITAQDAAATGVVPAGDIFGGQHWDGQPFAGGSSINWI